jgi:hypothetical protein
MTKVETYRPKTGGRARGTPNRVTTDVRRAIAIFGQENVHRLQEWLDRIACEDPGKAADLYVRLLEYHVPRLARSEIAIQPRDRSDLKRLSLKELEAILAEDEAERLERLPALRDPCDDLIGGIS